MDNISIVGRIVLVVVNIILLFVSLAMITVGLVILAEHNVYTDLLDKMKERLDEATESLEVETPSSNLSLNGFIFPVAYFCVITGCVLGILAVLGCMGAWCVDKKALIVYVIPMTLLFIVQLIVVTTVYTDMSAVDSILKPYMKDTLESYAGIKDTNSLGLAWNAVMNYFKCCGVDDYRDLKLSKNWPPTTIGGVPIGSLHTPIMCCKNKTAFPWTCATAPNDNNNNWKVGCYVKLRAMVLDNELVYNAIIVVLAFQFPPIVFAIWIILHYDTDKPSQSTSSSKSSSSSEKEGKEDEDEGSSSEEKEQE